MSSANNQPKKSKKYERIYAELRQMVVPAGQYTAGTKLPSESELVKRFGASRPTVGRALAQLESDGLVRRRAGSGTFVCAPVEPQDHVFGLLIPELGTTEIFEPICHGISQARLGSHYDLLWGPIFDLVAATEEQAERLCDYFIKRKVSGVFFTPLELTRGKDEVNARIVKRLDEAGIAIVLLDRDICDYPQRSGYDLVGIDNQRAGFVITEHVISMGAERILFFAGPRSAPTVKARMSGYLSAMRSVTGRELPVMAEFADAASSEAVRETLERHTPDAIICANDVTAAHMMTTLRSLGVKVPAQVKITGIDDGKYASLLQVPLTTIHQPCSQIGATALMAMLDRLAHPDVKARDFLVQFDLVVRQSTQRNGFAL